MLNRRCGSWRGFVAVLYFWLGGAPACAFTVSPVVVACPKGISEVGSRPDGRCVIFHTGWQFFMRLSLPELRLTLPSGIHGNERNSHHLEHHHRLLAPRGHDPPSWRGAIIRVGKTTGDLAAGVELDEGDGVGAFGAEGGGWAADHGP